MEEGTKADRNAGLDLDEPAKKKWYYKVLFSRDWFERRGILPVYKDYVFPMTLIAFVSYLLCWILLPIFWGSTFKSEESSVHFNGILVNRDPDVIGNYVTKLVLDTNHGPLPHNTWSEIDPKEYQTTDDMTYLLEPKQSYWVALEIREGATDALREAQANGDTSWDPQSVISIYYSSSRGSATVSNWIVGPLEKLFKQHLPQLNFQLSSDFISKNAENPSALQTATQAPQTLVDPVSYKPVDLRPWLSVASAPTAIGLVFLVILTFQFVLAEYRHRDILEHFFCLKHVIIARIFVPSLAALPVALMYALLNTAYELPYGAAFDTYGEGFVVFWLCTYCAVIVFFWTLNSVITVITPRFIVIFFVTFLITNVSTVHDPVQSMNPFYFYGYMMPFYNLRQIYAYIWFDSGERNEILKHMGVIWAWGAVLLLTYPFSIWFDYRRRHEKSIWSDEEAASAYHDQNT